MPRIAITGLGAVSACGNNCAQILEGFSSLRRKAGPPSLFESDLDFPVFEADISISTDGSRMRTVELTIHALKEAIDQACLFDFSGIRLGICLGTTVASQLNDIAFYKEYRQKGSASFQAVDRFLKGNLACAIADHFSINPKFCITVVNACSSGADAIGVGLSWLNSDLCDVVIAGGADELSRIPFAGFNALGVVSDSLCAPFDRDRKGLNLGEGAGVLIMEKEATASKRGIKPELFINGYGLAADAYHLTSPHPQGKGLKKAIGIALNNAKIKPEDVSFINVHGTATRENDKSEGLVLKEVFGREVKFTSTKGFTGHTLGAAGGLEAIFTALSLSCGWIPSSVGFMNMDPDIGISPVSKKTQIEGRYALSTSLAFGGNNSALVISKD